MNNKAKRGHTVGNSEESGRPSSLEWKEPHDITDAASNEERPHFATTEDIEASVPCHVRLTDSTSQPTYKTKSIQGPKLKIRILGYTTQDTSSKTLGFPRGD